MKTEKKNFPMRTTLLLFLMMLTSLSAWADYLYLEISGTSATMKYDGNYDGNPYYDERADWWYNGPEWDGMGTIKTITVDASCLNVNYFNLSALFSEFTGLETINNIGNLNTSNVEDMSRMFVGCSSLTTLDLSGWNTSKVTDMLSMFEGCSNLTTLKISGWDMSKVTNTKSMFEGCSILASISFPESLTIISTRTFKNCTGLTSVTLYAPSCTLGDDAFEGCNNLANIYVFSDYLTNYQNGNWSNYYNAGKITAITPYDSGNCGKDDPQDVTWQLVGEAGHYRLIISGTGDMADYTDANDQPWAANRNDIKKIIINNGVTSIGSYAFDGCTNLTTVTLNSSPSIGTGAFPDGTTVTIANGQYLYNGTEVLSGTITDMTKLNGKTLQTTIPYTDDNGDPQTTPIDWATQSSGDSESDPYIIYNKDQLLLLAYRVNGTHGETATTYQGKYFKLGANIAFTYDPNETADYDENYEGIGGYYNSDIRIFNGNFNGDGHTVSGIRLRKTGSGAANDYQGLFGEIGKNAIIHDVNLTDARIKGKLCVGGIVGYSNEGTVRNCTVTESDITATSDHYGTICGFNFQGIYSHNYYRHCTVNGTANATNVGCMGADITDTQGAMPAVKITLPTGVTATSTNVFTLTDGTYALPGATVTIAAATSYIISNVNASGADLTNNGDGTYTFTVGTTDVTVTATVLTNIVTQSNFSSFFDANGELLDEITFNELIFQGNFSNLVSYITLDRAITITGDNAVLNNMGFIIAHENVTLDKMTLVANTSLGDLIYVGASNVDLTNLNITYTVGDDGANVINVAGTDSDPITDVNILNNTINFESHATSDDQLVTAINLNNVENVVVDGNTIAASLPALYVNTYDWNYFIMGLIYVNPIRIYESYDVELTNNKVDVTVNSSTASYPTVQALYIAGSEDILVKGNDFKMVDTETPAGTPIYLYAVECGFSDGIEFIDNNFDISTTGGQSGSGSAYVLQAVTSEAAIIGNNITCESNGSSLGISSPYGFGPAKDLVIKNNLIDVTGYATESNDYALISGIEIQTGYATIYNNTICVQNKGGYDDSYPVSGVSAIQYSASTLSFDIQDNDIYVPDGKYAVEMRYAPSSATVTENALIAHELTGDAAVYFKSGDNNTVENNLDAFVNMPKTGESTYYIPANVSLFKVYDDGGQGWRYSPGCDGTLVLTAPMGYSLQLSGNITTEKDNDYLTVYDGSDNQADVLIDQMSSSANGTETDITTVTSTGRNMTLYFYSNNSGSDNSEFDGLNLTVKLIYNLNETNGITAAIATEIADKPAQFKRTGITADAYSTVCLPFDFTAPTGCTIYGFQGIHYDEDALGAGQGAWVADIAAASTMTAHTPYIFKSTGTEVTFSGTASDAADYSSALESNAVSATVGTDQAWTFKGTYSAIDWSSADPTEPTYGFSTYVPAATIAAGTFVRFVQGASLAPFRARLIYSGTDTHLNAPKRSAATDLPQYIIVRIVESDGSTTAIGTLDTRTGEISTGDWFDLNGRRLSGKPTKKGIYVKNGRKVVLH